MPTGEQFMDWPRILAYITGTVCGSTRPLNVSYVVASDLTDGSMPFPMHTCRISDDQIDAIQVKPRGSFKKPRRAGARRALTQLR
jgi:hypothetical protein